MNPSPQAVAILNKVRGVKNKPSGDGWMSFCPAHDDGKERGLSITEVAGKIVIHCFAGCSAEAVMQSIGLAMTDLFEDSRHEQRQVPTAPRIEGRTVSRFVLPDGSVAEHKRIDQPEGKRMWWTRNGKNSLDGYPMASIPLYGYHTIAFEAVLVVEGEKAADAIHDAAVALKYSVVATVCGAGSIPSDEVLSVLKGHYVALWPDNDTPGRQHMERIAYRLAVMKEWPFMVPVMGMPPKGDAADFTGDLGALLQDAVPWNDGDMPTEPPSEPPTPKEQTTGFRGW